MSSFDKEKAFHLLEELKRYTRMREESDYIMPVFLPFLPVILLVIGVLMYVIGAIAAIATGFESGMGLEEETSATGTAAMAGLATVGLGLLVLGLLIEIYVVYKWVDRRNKHFKRMAGFFTVLGELAELLGFKHAASLRSRINEYKAELGEKNAALNAILSFIIPIYAIYVYHFLNKDFVKHSKLEKLIMIDLFDDIREKEPSFVRRAEELKEVPDRSTILYFIITILFTPFLFYWVYTLTKDPNEHFKSHAAIEEDMVMALEKIVKKAEEELGGEGAETLI